MITALAVATIVSELLNLLKYGSQYVDHSKSALSCVGGSGNCIRHAGFDRNVTELAKHLSKICY